MSPEEYKAIERRCGEEGWNKGNLAVWDEVLAPDYVDHSHVYPMGDISGREKYKEFVSTMRTGYPDLQVTKDKEDDCNATLSHYNHK